jgi:hypothetical protein
MIFAGTTNELHIPIFARFQKSYPKDLGSYSSCTMLDEFICNRPYSTCKIKGLFIWRNSLPLWCAPRQPFRSSFFIIDINDVFQIFNDSRVQALGYADDLKIFMTIKSLNDCLILQRNLDNLMNWCAVNKFDLNASNCKKYTTSLSSLIVW